MKIERKLIYSLSLVLVLAILYASKVAPQQYVTVVRVYEHYKGNSCYTNSTQPEIIVFYSNGEVVKYPLAITEPGTREQNGKTLSEILNNLFNTGFAVKSQSSFSQNCTSITEYILE
jgi:hypothetical protein